MSRTIRLPGGSRAARIAALLAVPLVLYPLVTTRAAFVVGHLAPAQATAFAPGNGEVLTRLADRSLATVRLDDADAFEALNQRALHQLPFNAVATRNVGLMHAARGDEARAYRMLDMAASLSQRDYLTHGWLLDYAFRNNRIDDAMRHADIVLRQRPASYGAVIPGLVALLDDPRMLNGLSMILATDPPWRGALLQEIGNQPARIEAGYRLLSLLRRSASPPTSTELRSYFMAATAQQDVDRPQLYRRWLALLPDGTGIDPDALLRSGDFETVDAPPPFVWQYYTGGGMIAEPAVGPDGIGDSLYFSYTGRQQTAFVGQYLALPAGRYRITARAVGEAEIPADQLFWQITCPDRSLAGDLGLPRIMTQPVRFARDFVVPAGCDGQELQLVGRQRNGMAMVSGWVDSVRIDRLP